MGSNQDTRALWLLAALFGLGVVWLCWMSVSSSVNMWALQVNVRIVGILHKEVIAPYCEAIQTSFYVCVHGWHVERERERGCVCVSVHDGSVLYKMCVCVCVCGRVCVCVC